MTEVTKKLDGLEDELKLMKGELRQTLIDVRSFLRDLKLPPEVEAFQAPEPESTSAGNSPASPPSEGSSPQEVPGTTSGNSPPPIQGQPLHSPQGPSPQWVPGPTAGNLSPAMQDQPLHSPPPFAEAREPRFDGPPLAREKEDPGRGPEEPMHPEIKEAPQMRQSDEATHDTSRVNLMANLIRWVASARKEIGMEQLPMFLHAYAVAGDLSPGLRDAILSLAEIVDENSQEGNLADAWSRLMLELHGILTGGGTPVMPAGSVMSGLDAGKAADAEPEDVEPKPEPVRLKLVLPMGSGQEKEFSVTLNPDAGVDGH